MRRFEPSIWTARVDLSPDDQMRVQRAIAEEIRYHNGLVAGLDGPSRTMSDTIKTMTGKLEHVFGAVAALARPLSSIRADSIPAELANYADVLFENGKSALDTKTLMLMDVAAAGGSLHPEMRRIMAIEVLRVFRDQALALSTTLQRDGQVYRRSFDTLVAIDPRFKRHFQIPRAAIRVENDEDFVRLYVPGIAHSLRIPKPPLGWSIALLRHTEAGWNIELRRETSGYLLRMFDPVARKKKTNPRQKASA